MHIHKTMNQGGALATIDGQWKLLELIGKGSFAKVYKAENVNTGQLAAIKAIAADSITQDKILMSLQSEINILRSVVHPNIVKLLDYQRLNLDPEGRPIQTHYLVLEYCDGGDLADFLDARKRTGCKGVDEDTARRLLRMLAMGLREMHCRNIIHRDLKPGNILLASQGAHVSVKIADFGFARALEPARLANTLCGSPLYMAPEVLSEQMYDSRSDLWSVGVMLFEMLVGHVPFSGNNIVHLKKVIDSNEAFLPYDRREQLSPSCQDLVKRLLQKDPDARLSFAGFFSHPFLSGQPFNHPTLRVNDTHILVDEPASSAIEDDYVILSIPKPPVNPANHSGVQDIQAQFSSLETANSIYDNDPILEAQASRLPNTLSHSHWLYVSAQCIAEVADWKLVNSVPAAAIHLSMLAIHFHDRLLSQLAPNFSRSHVSADLGQSTQSPGYVTTAATDDSDCPTMSLASPPHSTTHCEGYTLDHESLADSSAGCTSHEACKPMDVLLRYVAKEDQVLCKWSLWRLQKMLQKVSQLSTGLLNSQPCPDLPLLLPLLWQGILSFSSSAALDEMFGAYASAAKGYAKAATLADIVRSQAVAQSDICQSPRLLELQRDCFDTDEASCHVAVSAPCTDSEKTKSVRSQRDTFKDFNDHMSSVEMHVEDNQDSDGCSRKSQSDVSKGVQSLNDKHEYDVDVGCKQVCGGQADGNMGDSALKWSWVLDAEQHRQLYNYIETISRRHKACMSTG